MSEQNKEQSPTINRASQGATGTQAYLLAAFCLVLGVALGYLFRGSASPAAQSAAAATVQQDNGSQKQGAEAQAAVAQAAAPYLEAVKQNPNDYDFAGETRQRFL